MAVSKKSKIPLRGIGKLFTHLDPGVRAKLESAFTEAESLINYHNESVTGKQDKRVISSYVSAPTIVLTQNSRGFDITWGRLDDPHISFYEAQVSLTSNFADPSVYKLVETSLTVEGVGETVYIRVRGVRWDGATGNWSNTVQTFFEAGGPIVYSRGLDDVPAFYIANTDYLYPDPIQHISITPQRQNGGMMIFGSLLGGPGSVIVTLNGVVVSQNAAPGAFGPVFIGHDQFYFSDSVSGFPDVRTTSGSSSGAGVHTNWTAANPTEYTVEFAYTASAQTIYTTYVNFTDFDFNIPTSNTIVGIKVEYTANHEITGAGPWPSLYLHQLRLLDAGVARADKVADPVWSTLPPTQPETKEFGSNTDLWGEIAGYWTPAKINDVNFGLRVKGKFVVGPNAQRTAMMSMTWPTITVYSTNETTGEVDVQIRHNVTPNTGVLQACTLNVIEFGEAIS